MIGSLVTNLNIICKALILLSNFLVPPSILVCDRVESFVTIGISVHLCILLMSIVDL